MSIATLAKCSEFGLARNFSYSQLQNARDIFQEHLSRHGQKTSSSSDFVSLMQSLHLKNLSFSSLVFQVQTQQNPHIVDPSGIVDLGTTTLIVLY